MTDLFDKIWGLEDDEPDLDEIDITNDSLLDELLSDDEPNLNIQKETIEDDTDFIDTHRTEYIEGALIEGGTYIDFHEKMKDLEDEGYIGPTLEINDNSIIRYSKDPVWKAKKSEWEQYLTPGTMRSMETLSDLFNRDKEEDPKVDIEYSLRRIFNNPKEYLKVGSFTANPKKNIIVRKNPLQYMKTWNKTITDIDGTTLLDDLTLRRGYVGKKPKEYEYNIKKAISYDDNGLFKDYIEEYNKTQQIRMSNFRRGDEFDPDWKNKQKKEKALNKMISRSKDNSWRIGANRENILNLLGNIKKEDNPIIEKQEWNRYININNVPTELSFEDIDICMFLKQFRFSTVAILKNLHGLSYAEMNNQLQRLRYIGLVLNVEYPGLGTIWALSYRGRQFTEYTLEPVNSVKGLPSPGGVPNQLAVQFVASYLYNNRANVLNLEDYPYHGKFIDGAFIKGEKLITETQINSSIFTQMKEINIENNGLKSPYSGWYMEQVGLRKQKQMLEWKYAFDRSEVFIPSPEFEEGNEFLLSTYPSKELLGQSFHNPDLIVLRERKLNGAPQSIAIEVEQKNSSAREYENTFRCYLQDNKMFDKVIWIVRTKANAKKIIEGAERANFKNYAVLPFIDETGPIRVTDFWFI